MTCLPNLTNKCLHEVVGYVVVFFLVQDVVILMMWCFVIVVAMLTRRCRMDILLVKIHVDEAVLT